MTTTTETVQTTAVRQLAEKRRELDETEVALARAEHQMNTDAVIAAKQRADVLRGFIARLEPEAAAETEAQHKAAAEQRTKGISRAFGSLAKELDEDETRVRNALDAARAAIQQMNDRYAKLDMLRAEAAALADRFGLEAPSLRAVSPPATRQFNFSLPNATHGFRPTPRYAHCEHELRQRRTYEEIDSTEGYRIIEAAGLKPWPKLTDAQQRILAVRAREQERLKRELAGLPKLAPEQTLARVF